MFFKQKECATTYHFGATTEKRMYRNKATRGFGWLTNHITNNE